MSHLVRRFFGFLSAEPLTPAEQQFVHDALVAELRRLFFAQSPQDQRHALDVAERAGCLETDAGDPRLEAALLHDIGKSGLGMGALARSFATLWTAAGLSTRGRWTTYADHGTRGARILREAGASELAVAFAEHHPGPVPEGIRAEDWAALSSADEV